MTSGSRARLPTVADAQRAPHAKKPAKCICAVLSNIMSALLGVQALHVGVVSRFGSLRTLSVRARLCLNGDDRPTSASRLDAASRAASEEQRPFVLVSAIAAHLVCRNQSYHLSLNDGFSEHSARGLNVTHSTRRKSCLKKSLLKLFRFYFFQRGFGRRNHRDDACAKRRHGGHHRDFVGGNVGDQHDGSVHLLLRRRTFTPY